jgi:facilitated trehalose transporter
LDVKSSKQLGTLLKSSGAAQSSEDEFENQRKAFQARKHKSLDPRHISFKLDEEKEPTPSTSSDEDYDCERTSLLMIDPDITKPVVIDLNVSKTYLQSH